MWWFLLPSHEEEKGRRKTWSGHNTCAVCLRKRDDNRNVWEAIHTLRLASAHLYTIQGYIPGFLSLSLSLSLCGFHHQILFLLRIFLFEYFYYYSIYLFFYRYFRFLSFLRSFPWNCFNPFSPYFYFLSHFDFLFISICLTFHFLTFSFFLPKFIKLFPNFFLHYLCSFLLFINILFYACFIDSIYVSFPFFISSLCHLFVTI